MAPVQVVGLGDVAAIDAGGYYNCALLTDGSVQCWGYSYPATPVFVPGIEDATMISTGYVHSCAVLVSGELKCWGYNAFGQLGDGSTSDSLTPVTVVF